jgi:hypothetical protein
MFGFSINFAMAVISRFLWGFLNGNIGVSKTYMGEITDDCSVPMLQSNEINDNESYSGLGQVKPSLSSKEPDTRDLDNNSMRSRGERLEPTLFDKESSQMKQALESLSRYNKVFVKGRQSSVDYPPIGIPTKPSTPRSWSRSTSQSSIAGPPQNESREEDNSARDECSHASSFQPLKSKWDSSDNQTSLQNSIFLAKTETEHAA